MLQIKLILGDIDYESMMKMVYPVLLTKISGKPSRNLLLRLIREMGEDGEKVLLTLMEKLPQERKNQLVCHCLTSYGSTLMEKLNEVLQEDTWGKHFRLDSCKAELDNERLILTVQNVQVDFKAILMEASESKNLEKIAGRVVGNGLLGAFATRVAAMAAEQAAQATEAMTPEELETAGIALLNKDAVQKKLMDVITKALTKKNIPMTIEEISVVSFDLAVLPEEKGQSILDLPEELEDSLIKALADFLREVSHTAAEAPHRGAPCGADLPGLHQRTGGP